ncbi:hypothetical protein CHS0354_009656 [Potamilus streckersoni]|uniref:RING-CH-type domain-containing protein n=1 Tax=Potamilus streckersoni TaxID=2493646 RepID=A0AAE0S483_9BIVA|nr:hypothetical protein CHS0354_009656 [Potamilus streckersoni]
MDYQGSYCYTMPHERLSDDNSFLANGQHSKEKSENLKITDTHIDKNNSNNCEQYNRERNSNGEEMKFSKTQTKSDKTPNSTVETHSLSCPSSQIRGSHHEARKLEIKDNYSAVQSDFRNVETAIVPLPNTGIVNVYQCKYCSEESKDKGSLIVPCRCSGSLEHVHQDCLKNWIRVRYEGTCNTEPRCELCRYKFCHQKQYKWNHSSCPDLIRSDVWRYSLGSVCVFIAICSLLALVLSFGQENPFTKYYADYKADGPVTSNVNEINRGKETYGLSTLDNVKIVCGILFIIFSALCVFLSKSCNTPPHKFILRCIHSSKQWTILPYSASNDSLVTGNSTNV